MTMLLLFVAVAVFMFSLMVIGEPIRALSLRFRSFADPNLFAEKEIALVNYAVRAMRALKSPSQSH